MQTILIYSGGLDSTVLLYWLRRRGDTVSALSLDYGQRHRRELASAEMICAHLNIPWRCADLSALRPFLAGSSQTDLTVAVPYGHYGAETMKATIVPNRNMLFLAVAVAWAVSSRADAVAYAAHAGDHTIYPDCRPAFVQAMQQATAVCDWHPVQIMAPFLMLTKAEIVQIGAGLAVPFGETWSCYEGGIQHCGRCGTCMERQEAFQLAGIHDSTVYHRSEPLVREP